MRRATFLQTLFGIGVAGAVSGAPITRQRVPSPANGDCPVCGTTHGEVQRQYSIAMGPCIPVEDGSMQCEQHKSYFGDKGVIVRCAHCSAAFWINTVDKS